MEVAIYGADDNTDVVHTQQPHMELAAKTFDPKSLVEKFSKITQSLEKMQKKIDKLKPKGS